jgi:1-hydroxycarotenoid 3,4-desaturase
MPDGPERLLVLINAPADGDAAAPDRFAEGPLIDRTLAVLKRCGLEIEIDAASSVMTTPVDFHALFPATGGALYGRANHGSAASFERPGTTTGVEGLYLAGGSVHPGAGVPMSALSGRLAALRILEDFAAKRSARRARRPLSLPADPSSG